jgi:hypothetical protein
LVCEIQTVVGRRLGLSYITTFYNLKLLYWLLNVVFINQFAVIRSTTQAGGDGGSLERLQYSLQYVLGS